jgi:heat shock protein HslJ
VNGTSAIDSIARLSDRLAIATALALAGACASPAPRANDTLPWPDSTQAEWVAVSIGDSPVVPGTRVTVRTSKGDVGGYSGCNWYGVRRDSARGPALVEMTARGCRSDIQDQERRFTMLLPQAVAAVRRGDTLVLLDSMPSELITLVRRHPTPSAPTFSVATTWRLITSTMPGMSTDSVLLTFTADSVSGYGGCRDLAGTYITDADRLRFTYITMRTEDCANDKARVAEEHLTTAMSETEHFVVRGDTLVLTTFGGDTLVFLRSR